MTCFAICFFFSCRRVFFLSRSKRSLFFTWRPPLSIPRGISRTHQDHHGPFLLYTFTRLRRAKWEKKNGKKKQRKRTKNLEKLKF